MRSAGGGLGGQWVAQVSLELYTSQHVLVGTLDVGRYRLSDFFCDPTSDVVALDDAWVGDLERPDARPNRLAPANFRKHAIILVAALDTLTPEGPARSRYVPTAPIPVAASA